MKNFFNKTNVNNLLYHLKYANDVNEYLNVLKNKNIGDIPFSRFYKSFDDFIGNFIKRFGYNIKNIETLFKALDAKVIHVNKIQYIRYVNYIITYTNNNGNVFNCYIEHRIKNF